jgi:hypothetical protein
MNECEHKKKVNFVLLHGFSTQNLTFGSNTSPGRNFPTCRKIIDQKEAGIKLIQSQR